MYYHKYSSIVPIWPLDRPFYTHQQTLPTNKAFLGATPASSLMLKCVPLIIDFYLALTATKCSTQILNVHPFVHQTKKKESVYSNAHLRSTHLEWSHLHISFGASSEVWFIFPPDRGETVPVSGPRLLLRLHWRQLPAPSLPDTHTAETLPLSALLL